MDARAFIENILTASGLFLHNDLKRTALLSKRRFFLWCRAEKKEEQPPLQQDTPINF